METYLRNLGVTETNTYLYIQGHHLFDLVVSPIVQSVCDALRNDRENEIRGTAQRQRHGMGTDGAHQGANV